MHRNLMNDQKFGFIKLLKLKYRMGDQIIRTFCKIGSLQKIRSSLFNLQKLEDSEKSTPESCRMDWNLMHHEEFGSRKLLKWKYRRWDEIIQLFCKIGSPQKLHHCFLICRNFKTLRKVVLDHPLCIEIKWMTKNMGP